MRLRRRSPRPSAEVVIDGDRQNLIATSERILSALAGSRTEDLIQSVARTTGKPILVVDQPDDDAARSVHGMFLSLPDRDVVVVSAGVERVHRDHVLMHEMAHLLLGHQLTGSDSTSDLAGLFTKLDPGLVASVLGRNHYSDPQEREAEWLASRIMLGTRGLNRGAWIDDPRLRRAAATVASLP